MKESHPYNLLDNKKARKLVDQVILGQQPISVLNKYFCKNKFLANCLVDEKLAKEFGFFKLNKKCLKELINIWILTGDGLSTKLPPEIIKHLNVYYFFVYCFYNIFERSSNINKTKKIINEYKKHNKPIISFKKLFIIAERNGIFSDRVNSIIDGVDYIMEFSKEFDVKIKPMVDHPCENWHISEYDLDGYASQGEWSKKNEKLKKRKLQNFQKLFKKWYEYDGYRRLLSIK
jgi:hypothetical protein